MSQELTRYLPLSSVVIGKIGTTFAWLEFSRFLCLCCWGGVIGHLFIYPHHVWFLHNVGCYKQPAQIVTNPNRISLTRYWCILEYDQASWRICRGPIIVNWKCPFTLFSRKMNSCIYPNVSYEVFCPICTPEMPLDWSGYMAVLAQVYNISYIFVPCR